MKEGTREREREKEEDYKETPVEKKGECSCSTTVSSDATHTSPARDQFATCVDLTG